jgi:hypothetical protein
MKKEQGNQALATEVFQKYYPIRCPSSSLPNAPFALDTKKSTKVTRLRLGAAMAKLATSKADAAALPGGKTPGKGCAGGRELRNSCVRPDNREPKSIPDSATIGAPYRANEGTASKRRVGEEIALLHANSCK